MRQACVKLKRTKILEDIAHINAWIRSKKLSNKTGGAIFLIMTVNSIVIVSIWKFELIPSNGSRVIRKLCNSRFLRNLSSFVVQAVQKSKKYAKILIKRWKLIDSTVILILWKFKQNPSRRYRVMKCIQQWKN